MAHEQHARDDEIAQLQSAIAAQEAQRAVLGAEVVDVTVAALRARIEALRTGKEGRGSAAAVPPDIAAQLQRHIPQALAEKLKAIGRIAEEHRQVTVVFADVTGFTSLCEERSQEEVAAFTDDVLRELSEAVYVHEGYIDKFLGDAVMAIFGAPLAHEDDEERALRAALEMRRRMERLDRAWRERLGRRLELHIGVNTGEVIAGYSGLQMSYRVIGDTVNTASRLGEAAPPGKIYVSRDTYRHTREAFSFLAMEPIRVKGKARPVVAYELERARLGFRKARGLGDLAPTFVGREAPMAELGDLAAGLRAGRGRILLVRGEAGIGKSRLMEEWRAGLRAGGSVNWVEGRCLPFTAALAYGPFLDLMRRYAGIDEGQSEEAARRRLDLAVGRFFPAAPEARAVFANLLGLTLAPEERSLLETIPARDLRDRLVSLVEAVFTTLASDCPTVLVVEDLHWVDRASCELLEHLFPLVGRLPLVIAMVSREEAGGSGLLATVRTRHADLFTEILLKPLPEQRAVEMASRLLSLAAIPETLRDLVVRRTEGNPFFIEEMIRSLIEQGALARVGTGAWQVEDAIGRAVVPDTIHGLLMARLDRLPPETRQLAQRAAVIGRIFLYRVLRGMTEDELGIDRDLERMQREELIRERASDPELEYMFRHALTQEVAYGSLLAVERCGLHRRVGEVMEEVFPDRLGELTGIVGEHFLKGEAWEKAAWYLVRAGDAAARLFANVEARKHFAGALDAIDRLPDAPENWRKKVDTMIKFSRAAYFGKPPKELLERLEDTERIAEKLPGPDGTAGTDKLRLAHVHFHIGLIHYSANRMREAIGYYQKVLAAAPALGDQELTGIPSFAIGNAILFQGHIGKAKQLLGQGMEALTATGNLFWLGRAKAFHAYAVTMMGDCYGGQAEALEALEIGRRINASNVICASNLVLTGAYSYADLTRDGRKLALEAGRRAIEVAEQAQDLIMLYIAHGVRAWNLAMFGSFEEASSAMVTCEAMARKTGEQLFMVDHFASRKAEIALGLGRIGEAKDLAEQAIAISRKVGGIWAEGHSLRILALALAAQAPASLQEAQEAMSRSIQVFESGQNLMGVAHTRIAWGKICNDRGDHDAAREHWGKALAFFESKGLAKRAAEARALLGN